MTGSSARSSRRFRDITRIPVALSGGRRPNPMFSGFPLTPRSFGMLGPVTSASRTPTR